MNDVTIDDNTIINKAIIGSNAAIGCDCKIGDGKTTLHQLVQWVFYGRVRFNKTATDRLYNLQYENDCSFGDTFDVMGCVDFEHDGAQYSLRRTYT